jgi:transcriptional regulator with XRE-family HTH domain
MNTSRYYLMNFSKNVKFLRTMSGLSMDDLARRAGVCKGSIFLIEASQNTSIDKAQLVCMALSKVLRVELNLPDLLERKYYNLSAFPRSCDARIFHKLPQ